MKRCRNCNCYRPMILFAEEHYCLIGRCTISFEKEEKRRLRYDSIKKEINKESRN